VNVASLQAAGFCIHAVYAAIAGVLWWPECANSTGPLQRHFRVLHLPWPSWSAWDSLIGPYIAGLASPGIPRCFAGVTALHTVRHDAGSDVSSSCLLLPRLVAIPSGPPNSCTFSGTLAKAPEGEAPRTESPEFEIDLRARSWPRRRMNGDSPRHIRAMAARAGRGDRPHRRDGLGRRMRGANQLERQRGTLLEVRGGQHCFEAHRPERRLLLGSARAVHACRPERAGKSTLFTALRDLPPLEAASSSGTDLTGLPS